MKIGMYSPYLPRHFGGGEKHFLTTAWYLSQQHTVELLIPRGISDLQERRKKYEQLFDLDLSSVLWKESALADRTSSAWDTWRKTSSYEAFFYLTDGSLFFSGAGKNILHIQVPFRNAQSGVVNRLKLSNWTTKNANSQFTQRIVEESWKTTIPFLHYPYVRVPSKNTWPKKENAIIAVGRFVAPGHATHSKGQEVLIETMAIAKKERQLANFSLHLVGSIEPGEEHQRFVERLKKQAQGLPVQFWHGISHQELSKLYEKSLLFWHAAGWQVDEQQHPEQVEHFGMTTIEAMAHGCIPIVVAKGGSREIITENTNGFFFSSLEELLQKSVAVTNLTSAKRTELQQAARARAEDFSLERFCQTIDRMMEAA